MSRAGRKRKHEAKRHECGKIVQKDTNPTTSSPNKIARAQPHRMRLYEDICDDARAATALGQLNLVGVIPNDLYAAAERFAGIVRRWRAVIDAPRPAPSVAGLGTVSEGGYEPLPADSDEPKTPEEEFSEYRADYERAVGWLSSLSRDAKSITLSVVAEGGRVPAKGFQSLMKGLIAIKYGVQKSP